MLASERLKIPKTNGRIPKGYARYTLPQGEVMCVKLAGPLGCPVKVWFEKVDQ